MPIAGPNASDSTQYPLQEFPSLSRGDRVACNKKQCDLSPRAFCFLTSKGKVVAFILVCVSDIAFPKLSE